MQPSTRKDYMIKNISDKALEQRRAWEDDTMRGAEYVKKYTDHIMKERSQLYGVIIHLMLTHEMDTMEFPDIEVFNQYGKDYYILFEKVEDTENYRARLLKQEPDEH